MKKLAFLIVFMMSLTSCTKVVKEQTDEVPSETVDTTQQLGFDTCKVSDSIK